MDWKNKARIAKAFAKLPSGLSYSSYYLLQRHFGALRTVNPLVCLRGGVAMVDMIRKHKRKLTGSETFLEVGTGWCLSLPIALWLCGAFRTITVDLNPYLKSELVFEEIEYIRNHQEMVTQVFGPHSRDSVFQERFELLLQSGKDLDRLLSSMNVDYIAPADATRLDLAGKSIDYHVSFMALQHIRPEPLAGILREGRRLVKASGLLLHHIVFGDLFSDFDRSISPVNFLQFSDQEWESIAGNRFMYHNRLRVDELREIFEDAGLAILDLDPKIDSASLRVLESGELSLDPRFRNKTRETNATINAWVAAAPSKSGSPADCESAKAPL